MSDNVVPFGRPEPTAEDHLVALEHASPFVAQLYEIWASGDAEALKRAVANHPEAVLWMVLKLQSLGALPPSSD